MEIFLNGEKEKIEPNLSLKAFLKKKEINPNTVACELNMKIIKRADLGQVILKEGDTLEVIRMIGGG